MTQLGFKGVQVLTNVNGRELSDPAFAPFWKKAEKLGVLVVIHPNGFTHAQRLTRFYFNNVIGNPLETTIALHYLIFDDLDGSAGCIPRPSVRKATGIAIAGPTAFVQFIRIVTEASVGYFHGLTPRQRLKRWRQIIGARIFAPSTNTGITRMSRLRAVSNSNRT